MTNRAWPNSTGSPFLASAATTLPATSASIWFIIFMASMMQSVSPAWTWSPIFTKFGEPGAGAS